MLLKGHPPSPQKTTENILNAQKRFTNSFSGTVTAGSELMGDMPTHVKNLGEEFAERAEKGLQRPGLALEGHPSANLRLLTFKFTLWREAS